ncbi:glycoside hydrolase family 99-like domain-containing protein [Acidisoma sp. S159]|uniref:glycoside hydrolase family 99-like domain-containing protein n=1 Tax=Acidisoma sp. S159 TaxID=1747225 RepID=UPI00131CC5B8|nr:glycoside hydrolase family 99-like domain-containing protein [Acidisoma sp. S159]
MDDRVLFRNFGLRRHQHSELAAVYMRLPARSRATLSPYFDVPWYISQVPGLAESDIDPFWHFCTQGIYRKLSPHPLVSLTHMLRHHPNLLSPDGALECLVKGLEVDLIPPSPYFDINYYFEKRPSARLAPNGPLRDFIEQESKAAVVPNEYFDADFYIERYRDVPGNIRDAYLHFVVVGDRQARFPSQMFDSDYYLRNNPDVAEAKFPPLMHFIGWGRAEGRRPVGSRRFDVPAAAAPQNNFTSCELDPKLGRERYREAESTITKRKQARLAAVSEHDVRPVVISDVREALEDLSFVCPQDPKVSILIPCYDNLKLTLECLLSIAISKSTCSFEIVVADDCSPDPEVQRLRSVAGLVYIRQPKTLNFLRNCNAAFRSLRGEYVLLLNNDAQICEGALDALVMALDSNPLVGAVGPKILFPNGRLQEAGCIVNRDASTTMIGVSEDPAQPCYSYDRDVDYVSGAALMFRRSLARGDLFEERLAPAYCEDVDLCLHLSSRGYTVRYIASATVVHHLSMSFSDHGKKVSMIRTNQQKLVELWGERLARMNEVRVIAFYLPQFHPIPENDRWWGAGFTEWTNVTKAQASYQGHYQPHLPSDLGFYDLRLADALRKQAHLLQRYELGGFCMYYYNFGGKALLDTPLRVILDNPDIKFPFCLCWANENWSRRWDGGVRGMLMEQQYDDETIDSVADSVSRIISDPRYIRVDGKALFLIYRPLLIPRLDNVLEKIRTAARAAGGGELQIVLVEGMEFIEASIDPMQLGFDASVEFPPQGIGVAMKDQREVYKSDWSGTRYNYQETVAKAILTQRASWPSYTSVFPSWDNTARQPLLGTSFDLCSPEVFQFYCEKKIEQCKERFTGSNRLMFVNAWNEWAEGAHLEPDRVFGHSWLEAVRNALLSSGSL